MFEENQGTFTMVDYVNIPALLVDQSYARIPNGTGDFETWWHTPGGNNELSSTKDLDFQDLELFPNPVHNSNLFFRKKQGNPFARSSAQIVNLQGQSLVEYNLDSNNDFIVLPELASGIYFLKIQSKEGIHTGRFIIQ